jgi:phosphate uptake regulator
VLQSQHAVTAFKAAILRDAEEKIAKGAMGVDFAFRLHELASQCELMADHCTNMAEQVIYVTTGAIVRHTVGVGRSAGHGPGVTQAGLGAL